MVVLKKTSMKNILLLAILVLALILFSFQDSVGSFTKYHNDGIEEINSSSFPPTGRTGAPGESTCTSCHGGTAFAAAGKVNYSFSGTNNEYLPGNTYSITLSMNSGTKNGFQMTILDGNDDQAGTFTAGTNSATSNAGGRNYIFQTTSNGVTSWTFDWTAPSSTAGNLTAFYTYNKSNASGNSSGDSIFVGQQTILESPVADLTDYQKLEANFNVYCNGQANQLILDYKPHKAAEINLQVTDLSGKIIYRDNLGQKGPFKQKEQIDLNMDINSGIYLITVFVDNYTLCQKVVL
jgi:hypothetical protein